MMLSTFFGVLLALIVRVQATSDCGKSPVQQSRIIAGSDARPGAWPWMASLWLLSGGHICGGSLLNSRWVLTASHCVKRASPHSLMVKLGEHDHRYNDGNEQVFSVQKIIKHPSYRRGPIRNDIALIKLSSPARINDRVRPICLPKTSSRPPIGSRRCYLSGWGSVRHPGPAYDILQQAMLPIVPQKHCFNKSGFICTGYGRDSLINACRGDSGGPLVCRKGDGTFEQHGIASFVVEYCKYYTAFTPVSDYINWINRYINT